MNTIEDLQVHRGLPVQPGLREKEDHKENVVLLVKREKWDVLENLV